MNKVELGQLLHLNNIDMDEVISELSPRIMVTDGHIYSTFVRPEVEQMIRKMKGSSAILTPNNRDRVID